MTIEVVADTEDYKGYKIPVVKVLGMDDGDDEGAEELSRELARLVFSFIEQAINNFVEENSGDMELQGGSEEPQQSS